MKYELAVNRHFFHLSLCQGDEKKTIPTWVDYLLLDKRIRIFYVLLLCLFIGIILPGVISYYLGEYRADLGNCDTPTLYK